MQQRKEEEMRRLRRLSTLLGGLVTVALAFALPAQATRPQSQSFVFTQLDSMSCAGFDANVERNFTGRETAYFDKQGSLLRVHVEAAMRGSVTNSVSGKTVALRGHISIDIDPVTGAAKWAGPVFMGNEPGAGSVIKDTGRIVFDANGSITFEAGPHDVIDTNGGVFCTAVG
jgi:hypothetical protein